MNLNLNQVLGNDSLTQTKGGFAMSKDRDLPF